MRNLKFKKTANTLILLAYLATQTIVFGEIVLCKGDDGHLSYEFAYGGKCTDSPETEADHQHDNDSEHPTLQCELDHCGDCEDIPVSFDAAERITQKSVHPLEVRAPHVTPPFAVFSAQLTTTILAPLPPKQLPEFPCFISTTILLL